MADADLDVVIRLLAKQQNKGLMAAAKSRRDRYLSLAAKAKDKETKERYSRSRKIPCRRERPPQRGCKFPPTTPPTVTQGPCAMRQRPTAPNRPTPPKRRSRRQRLIRVRFAPTLSRS